MDGARWMTTTRILCQQNFLFVCIIYQEQQLQFVQRAAQTLAFQRNQMSVVFIV